MKKFDLNSHTFIKRPRDERETTINFNDSDSIAYVTTCNIPIIKRLIELESVSDEVKFVSADDYEVEYQIPKRLVTFSKPRSMTEEQKAAATERLKKARKSRWLSV
jgi:hypothetical protein